MAFKSKLLHILNIISDGFWRMARPHFPPPKVHTMCLTVLISMGLVAFANNALRTYILEHSGPPANHDTLERDISDPELDELERGERHLWQL